MAKVDSVDGKAEDGILPSVRAFSVIVVSSNPFEFQVICPVRADSFDHPGLSTKALNVVVVGMIMADQNDVGLIWDRAVTDGSAESTGFIWINYDLHPLVRGDQKSGMAVIFDLQGSDLS